METVRLPPKPKHCYIYRKQSEISHTVTNYNQQYATFLEFISTGALHVSGGSSAHHQEHITIYSFRYCQPILLLAASSSIG